ncbi:putative reverse transcriptase domain-containing protein [Tanacetum coccineum]
MMTPQTVITPDTPSSLTHDTPFLRLLAFYLEILSYSSSEFASYRYHLNGPVHMMTARKKVRPLPVQQLVASLDFHSDASSDSLSRHLLSDHSSPDLPSTSAGPSRKRRRSPMTSVHALPPVSRALSPVRADLLPSPKRIRDSGYLTDVEVDLRETSLRDDVIVRGSDEPHLEQDIDPEIQAEIDECFAYADALKDRGIDARVVVEAVDQVESDTSARGPVKVRVEKVTHHVMPDDIPKPAQEGSVEVTYETLGDLVQRFHDHTEAIPVHRIQVIEGVQREQGHRIVGVESAVTVLTKRITETHGEIKDLIAHRVAEEIEAREATINLEPLNENRDEQGNGNGGNGNGGNGEIGNGGNGGNGNEGNGENGNGGNGENGNGYRNMNHGMNYGGFMAVARECTFQDFLKCKPQNFSGTEGVVGLTCWFEKMETRTIGVDVAYAMNWAGLMRLMTEVYCPRNEIQKMETELWNMTVKGNDLTAYIQRFQGLILLYTRIVPDEEDKVERFIGGLPDNIQGNVIATEPTKLQDAIRIANNLLDQKLKGYARSVENKRSLENNPRDNRGQQPVFKRQNVGGQNVARAYTAGNNERKGYVGPLPYCNKCRLHHEGLCTIRCGNCKKVGHLTRDCRAVVAPNTQRAAVGNQSGVICYECGRPRHFRKDSPKLKNQNHGN